MKYEMRLLQKFLLVLLMISLSLPEAFDQRYSLGVIWIGGLSLLPADLVSFFILILALLTILLYGTVIKSLFAKPLLLLFCILIIQGLRTIQVYELQDIIKDLRPIFSWLTIIAFPQLFRSEKAKKYFVKYGIFIAVTSPVMVVAFTIARYIIEGPFVTFSEVAQGRIMYVNGSIGYIVAMVGFLYIFTRQRKYKVLFVILTTLYLISFIMAKSRGLILEFLLVYGSLIILSIKQRKISLDLLSLMVGTFFLMIILYLPFQQEVSMLLNRFMFTMTYKSFMTGHDLLRISNMWQQFLDFLKNPLIGVGLGKPYYGVLGPTKGKKLTSPSDSLVIDLSAKTGLMGITLFLLILLKYFKLLRSLLNSENLPLRERSLVWSLFITFPYLIFGCILGNGLWHFRTPPLYMALIISIVESIYHLFLKNEFIELKRMNLVENKINLPKMLWKRKHSKKVKYLSNSIKLIVLNRGGGI
jgi:hypothetical protein